MEPDPGRDAAARVCGRCHATRIGETCIAGDCGQRPLIQTPPRNWDLMLDYMSESLGCIMAPIEKKMIAEYLIQNHPGQSYPITWTELLTTRASTGWNIVALTAWNGHLYAGTEGGGRIVRSADGVSWTEAADTHLDRVYGITPFQGALYAGGHNPRPEIWKSDDGVLWKRAASLPPDQHGVNSLAVFNGKLYAGTAAAGIYRSSDGVAWTASGSLKRVKAAGWPYWVRFLREFKGNLYAGLEGGGLYTSGDGENWKEIDLPLTKKAGVRGAEVFNGRIYLGTTGTGEIWRSGDGKIWEKVFERPNGRGYSGAMAAFNGMLYASMNGAIYRSRDGEHWDPAGEISPKTVEAMGVFKDDLYAGTDRPNGSQIFRTTGLSPSRISTPARDIPVAGKIDGTYSDLQTPYSIFERLEESRADGVPVLEHKWSIPHSGGVRLTLAARGYRSGASNDNRFVFSYSPDDKTYVEMFSISDTNEDRAYRIFQLPVLPSGNLFVRVLNTNRIKTRDSLEKLYLDHLYLLSEG